ncbi:MAG: hypothetical protein LBE71_02640, partial [Dysgonamonadaceae bacterium]|nr:hypothetical protein [Dysgonamonadaceae bacterium]
MARVQTQINGISTQSTYTEGDCYSLVNLRPKNGALHPVPNRRVLRELSQKYDIIHIHRNSDYTNWIGIKHTNSNRSSVYNKIDTTPTLMWDVPKVTSVQQIGNMVVLITGEGIFHLLYTDQEYKVLGELPEMNRIEYRI